MRRSVGEAIAPTITSDRFSTYEKMSSRQVGWALLRRDFQAMIDRPGGVQEVGAKLMALSGRVVEVRREFSASIIRRTTMRGTVGWLRPGSGSTWRRVGLARASGQPRYAVNC